MQIDSVNGKTVTFNQLYVRVLRCISAFNNLGLEQNDVVGVCFSNSVEYPVVLLATFACGAIASTCYPNFREGNRGIFIFRYIVVSFIIIKIFQRKFFTSFSYLDQSLYLRMRSAADKSKTLLKIFPVYR